MLDDLKKQKEEGRTEGTKKNTNLISDCHFLVGRLFRPSVTRQK